MKLLDYVKTTRGGQRELADKLAITPVLIGQWANEKRPVPPARCVEIERATNGAVSRRDLRPDDWEDIWPELAAAPQCRRATDSEPEPAPDRPGRQPPNRDNVMTTSTEQPPLYTVKPNPEGAQ